MLFRSLRRPALVSLVALGFTLLTPTIARADDEVALEPKRVRVRILKSDGTEPTETDAIVWHVADDFVPDAATPAPDKTPMAAVMRWAMGEMGAHLTQDGAGSDVKAMLDHWFDGGSEVPMAGLRDALKADGWTADSLMAWMHRSAGQALLRAPQMIARMERGPWGQARQGPRLGGPGWRGGEEKGCPLCGMSPHDGSARRHGMEGRRNGQGFRHGGRRGPGRGPRAGSPGFGPGQGWRGQQQRGQGRHRQGARHQGRRGQDRGWRRGPGEGRGRPGQQDSGRAVIMWNDGSGWHRQEIPMGGHGPQGMAPRGMGPQGMGPQGMGPRGMGPHGMGPQGMGPQGMGPRGMGPQGMGPRGMGPQGMGPRGMGPQGRGPRGMGLGPAGPHGQAHPGEKPLGPPGDVKDADQEQMRELLKGLRSLSPSGEPMPWIEMLESFAPADGSDGDAAEKIQELLKGLGIDMRGAEASSRQVRVRLVRPEGKKKDGESEILIDEVVEDAPEKIKSKK